jgi:exonuclease-1
MEAREKALQLESKGMRGEAFTFFQKAVEITSETVFTWVCELKRCGIEYIVAPYEADAELAFLARIGYVDCVLTEDSDLLAYQTPTTLFKLDDSMNVVCVNFSDVLAHLSITVEQFVAVCCLAGCDYLEEHIARMGIQTALKLIRLAGTVDKLMMDLRRGGKYTIPESYEEQLWKAMLTFKCQRVYDPRRRIMTTIEPMPVPDEQSTFLGAEMAPDLLMDLVAGDIDTRTLGRLRPANATGSVSPYFEDPKPKGNASPYFATSEKARKGTQTGGNGFTGRCVASYFQLAPR